MKKIIQSITTRYQPKMTALSLVVATFGGTAAIAALILLGNAFGAVLLMAPFGATCVLLFSVPASPLSQPMNVIGGHIISTLVGIALHTVFPTSWWAIALSVGIAIGLMALLRITHPPAGADPIVVFFENLDIINLIFPVALGSIILVIVAWLVHSVSPTTSYPLTKDH
ncbi:MAG: HPP family protein [Gammaproteobacteria bacterium]|nr:HPP family protein [Gammaproteobacteria bacterium]